jgi:hypothetical protein
MIEGELHIARFSAWAPDIRNANEWKEWATGTQAMYTSSTSSKEGVSFKESKAPEITFTDSLFRRRLSQISRMTIQVVHDLLPLDENIKMIFISFRGELARQYKINKMVIEDEAIMPAAFSLSVFNAPIALASIALGLKGGYTAIYPGGNSFATGFATAVAAFLRGTDELLFVYADEDLPLEYKCLSHNTTDLKLPPLAFAILLTRKPCPNSVSLSSIIKTSNDNSGFQSGGISTWQNFNPVDFLKQLILCKEMYASP